MTIQVTKDTKPDTLRDELKKLPRKRTLRNFVGKLKRGIDGLEYQKEARNEWN